LVERFEAVRLRADPNGERVTRRYVSLNGRITKMPILDDKKFEVNGHPILFVQYPGERTHVPPVECKDCVTTCFYALPDVSLQMLKAVLGDALSERVRFVMFYPPHLFVSQEELRSPDFSVLRERQKLARLGVGRLTDSELPEDESFRGATIVKLVWTSVESCREGTEVLAMESQMFSFGQIQVREFVMPTNQQPYFNAIKQCWVRPGPIRP